MSDWNTSIIQEFRANEGKVGGQFEGASLILIHHIGAKSGTERVTPISCFPQPDGRFAIIASNGGAPTNPDWYYNLKADPDINVEFGTETFAVSVRKLAGAEREKLWAEVVSAEPGVVHTQNRTARTIPVLLLTRISRRPSGPVYSLAPPVPKASHVLVTSGGPATTGTTARPPWTRNGEGRV